MSEALATTNGRLETSADVSKLAEALAKAQAEIKGATKDSDNPFFKSKYADLESVWEACRTALTNQGIAVIQAPSSEGNVLSVTTMLLHTSGQWARSMLSTTMKEQGPQPVGSATTYLRRYGLSAMAGVAPKDDDDGNAAQGNGQGPQGRGAKREAAQAETRRQNADSGPYAHSAGSGGTETVSAFTIDKSTGEVTVPAPVLDEPLPSFKELMDRRLTLPEALRGVIPTDEEMHAIPPAEATENVPYMTDAIIRKAKERKISTKEWGDVMARFFGSRHLRLLLPDKTPNPRLNPYFLHALFLDMDMTKP